MEEACQRAGRETESVRLIGVSKTRTPAEVLEATRAGLAILGENYIQEAMEKITAIGPGPSWHFIGRLQSNKARLAVERFDVIHSVDSLKLARRLNTQSAALGKRPSLLVQVNIGGEASKTGVTPQETPALVEAIAALESVNLIGLMTMPPPTPTPEQARPYFTALRKLGLRLGLAELSMGMSNDFEVAIEEGATMVRVGSALFGPRV